MNNRSSYCGLVDAKIRASEKDLPVWRGKADPWGKLRMLLKGQPTLLGV